MDNEYRNLLIERNAEVQLLDLLARSGSWSRRELEQLRDLKKSTIPPLAQKLSQHSIK